MGTARMRWSESRKLTAALCPAALWGESPRCSAQVLMSGTSELLRMATSACQQTPYHLIYRFCLLKKLDLCVAPQPRSSAQVLMSGSSDV